MSEYLTKEEIKQWRSSLEKITLEEYAKRLGKTLKEEKQTRDIIDLVLKNTAPVQNKFVSKAQDVKPASEKVLKLAESSVKIQNAELKEKINVANADCSSKQFTFKKPLTQREQTVLDYFIANAEKIVYAKDLAKILELPTDYVYKYIKNLRAKITEDVLQNAVKGGYKLSL